MRYRIFSRIYPRVFRDNYYELIDYSGIKVDNDSFIGFVVFFSFGAAIALSFFLGKLVNLLLGFLLVFVVLQAGVYFWLLLSADKKALFIEDIMPDALQLMSSNLRAGLTIDKALLLSTRPEFGPLKDELNLVGKEITTGKDTAEALADMGKRIRSESVEKTIALIISGLKRGGELSSLLSQTSENMRNQKLIEKRVRGSVLMYVVFIFAAIGFATPLLFGLGSFLVESLTNVFSRVDVPDTAILNMPLSVTEVTIGTEFIIGFSLFTITLTSILGSLTLGLINKGQEKRGIKYIPFLLIISIGIFFLVRMILSNMFGGLFSF